MYKLSEKKIKKLELNMLIEYDKFCKKNHLRYYLVGGTLLGAIRHKGFIPWDDDIDVAMPRPDFELFMKIAPKYFLQLNLMVQNGTGHDEKCKYPYGQIWNLNTTIKRRYTNLVEYLWLDIMVADGMPEDDAELKKIFDKCEFYRKIIGIANANLGKGKTRIAKYIKYLLKPLFSLYGTKRAIRNTIKLAKKYKYEDSKYVGSVTAGLYGIGERMLKSEYEKTVSVKFEGYEFPAYSCWDSYLRGIYGDDYMQLPPVEKRKTHDMEAYYIDE